MLLGFRFLKITFKKIYTVFELLIIFNILILISFISLLLLILISIFYFFNKKKSLPKKNKHILIGPTEVANNVYSFGKAFRKKGYQVTTIVEKNNFYKENYYNFVLSENCYLMYFQKAILFFIYINKADYFLCMWHPYLPFYLDYLFLKILNKKIIARHCGDDVRYRPIQRKIDRFLQTPSVWKRDDSKNILFFIRSFWTQKIPEILDIPIITLRDQATFQTKPAYHSFIPQEKILEEPKSPRSRPLLVHAPSEKKVKGTDFVLEAIKKLEKSNKNFQFELIYKKPNSYVLERLVQADIVIDQPSTWCGRLGIEAMASSCAVIGGNRAKYHQFDIKSPILQFKPDNVEDLAFKLDQLISDRSLREQKMRNSYFFWKRYYSEERIVSYFEDIFSKKKEPTLMPIPDIKSYLLNFSESYYQKLHIKFF